MSIICDGQFMNNVIDEFGDTIYLRVLQSRSYSNEYSDSTDVWTQYKIKGIMNVYSLDSAEVKEGTYYAGQITFLISTDYEDYLDINGKIYYPPTDSWYGIQNIRKHSVGDVTYDLEITVRNEGKVISEKVQHTITSDARIA